MVDSPTTRNRLRKQEVGTNVNSWGTNLNEALDALDQIIDGVETIALTSSADYTLLTSNYSTADEAKNRVLAFTGALSGPVNIIVPSVETERRVYNDLGVTLTVKTAAGAGVAIPTGYECRIYCDGVNVHSRALYVNGGLSIAGQIKNLTAGTLGTDGVNKTQMEAAIGALLAGTVLGLLLNSSTDGVPGFLENKTTVTYGSLSTTQLSGLVSAQFSTLNPGGDEKRALQLEHGYIGGYLPGGVQTTAFIPVIGRSYSAQFATTATLDISSMTTPQLGQSFFLRVPGPAGAYVNGPLMVNGVPSTGEVLEPGFAQALTWEGQGFN